MSNFSKANFKKNIENIVSSLIHQKIFISKETKLSSGAISPYYLDFRNVFSNTNLLNEITNVSIEYLNNFILNENYENYKFACIPVGSLPYTSILSYRLNIPLIIVRENKKKYGTKKLIEGSYSYDDNIILFDDVLSSGNSILSALDKFKKYGIEIKDIYILFDRKEGGSELIKYYYPNVNIHSLLNIDYIINNLDLNNENSKNSFIIENIKTFKDRQLKKLCVDLKKINDLKNKTVFYNYDPIRWNLEKYFYMMNPKCLNIITSVEEKNKMYEKQNLSNEDDLNDEDNLNNIQNQFINNEKNKTYKWSIGRIIMDLSEETDWSKISNLITEYSENLDPYSESKLNSIILILTTYKK